MIKDVNLENKKKQLDNDGMRIADNKERSNVNRKKLGQQTKGNYLDILN